MLVWNLFPTRTEVARITAFTGISELELKLQLGCFDVEVIEAIREKAGEIAHLIGEARTLETPHRAEKGPDIRRQTEWGTLYQGDCLDVLATMDDGSVDVVFADPPFNLNKLYASKIDDNLKSERYLAWCETWIRECTRVMREGGSFFLWNIPRWNSVLAAIIGRRLSFRHWIAVDIKYSLPIQGRLYPSHYSLLYFTKGPKPKSFAPDRLPMEVCPSCAYDLRDYGGYKDKMNPAGVNLSDVWYDIPPVRHAKYKRRKDANELSVKLLDRVLELASAEGDVVFDPFGGSGTTYVVAELKRRRWIGVELGPVDDILQRFDNLAEERGVLDRARQNLNALFTPETREKRLARGMWTVESERERKAARKGSLELDLG